MAVNCLCAHGIVFFLEDDLTAPVVGAFNGLSSLILVASSLPSTSAGTGEGDDMLLDEERFVDKVVAQDDQPLSDDSALNKAQKLSSHPLDTLRFCLRASTLLATLQAMDIAAQRQLRRQTHRIEDNRREQTERSSTLRAWMDNDWLKLTPSSAILQTLYAASRVQSEAELYGFPPIITHLTVPEDMDDIVTNAIVSLLDVSLVASGLASDMIRAIAVCPDGGELRACLVDRR